MTQLQRIAIVGAGHVGATAAYALMLRALVREIVLIDEDVARATAEAADLSDANALARPARIWAGDYSDAASAQIAVLTAGAATHGDESRLAVAGRSGAIVRTCVEKLVHAGFSGILLIAANPVDLMSLVALRVSGFEPARVIGTGTLSIQHECARRWRATSASHLRRSKGLSSASTEIAKSSLNLRFGRAVCR